MPTFVLTVQEIDRDEMGVGLRPGLPMEAFDERPALKTMMQGAIFELRRPDGAVKRTRLLTYGIAVHAFEGSLYVAGAPEAQPLLLTFPNDLLDADVPPGTEVWYMDGDAATDP
jgi:hypothetical protein